MSRRGRRREPDPTRILSEIWGNWRLHGLFGNLPPRFDLYRDPQAQAEAVAGYVNGVGSRWQPIETAPKDREIAYFAPGAAWELPDSVGVVEWHPDGGFCVCELRFATLWADLGPL